MLDAPSCGGAPATAEAATRLACRASGIRRPPAPFGGEHWSDASSVMCLLQGSYDDAACTLHSSFERGQPGRTAASSTIQQAGSIAFRANSSSLRGRRIDELTKRPLLLRPPSPTSFSSSSSSNSPHNAGLSSCLPEDSSGKATFGLATHLDRSLDALALELHCTRALSERVRHDHQHSTITIKALERKAIAHKEKANRIHSHAAKKAERAKQLVCKIDRDRSSFEAARVEAEESIAACRDEARKAISEARLSMTSALHEQRLQRGPWQNRLKMKCEGGVQPSPPAVSAHSATLARSLAGVVSGISDELSAAAEGGGLGDSVSRWPCLLRKVLGGLDAVLNDARPTTCSSHSALSTYVAAENPELDAATTAMAERLLELVSIAQAHGTTRVTELEAALFREQAKEATLADAVTRAKLQSQDLLPELAAARRQRLDLQAGLSEFVPFAARELETAVGRVASLRHAPRNVRNLAAEAKFRLRQRRRASSAGAKRNFKHDCGCYHVCTCELHGAPLNSSDGARQRYECDASCCAMY